MTTIGWLWIALSVAGALVLAAVVWLAGPLVTIGDAQPFEGVVTRLLIITLILLIVAAALIGAPAARGISRQNDESP